MKKPDGWENPYGEPDEKGRTTPLSKIYEEGADAILEKLIEKGIKTDRFATNGRPIYLSNPRKKGWYVFIEK